MLEQLLNHIEHNNLCNTTDKILLAVSGGLDSMVMLHLFREAGFSVGVAHCNFQLRAEASLADEELVTRVCVDQAIPFHGKRFDTGSYAAGNNLSVQMAARELRYHYFKEVIDKHQYQYLATAHHVNDSLETVLMNLMKGSGIEGLSGIPVKNGNIIRPMLFATKEMILTYASARHLSWREDASNASDDYQRNFVRHQIIPRMKEINPALEQTFMDTRERLAGAKQLMKLYVDNFRNSSVHFKNDLVIIDKNYLSETNTPAVLLWELIKDKGFNFKQCRDIIARHQAGKKFISSTHEVTVDREKYILKIINKKSISPLLIEKPVAIAEGASGTLHMAEIPREKFTLDKDRKIAQLDHDKIKYPLVWRSWLPGDSFIPLGMDQSKKISDFLIDAKTSLPEKEKITVIESGGEIVWVVGQRIHEHFKVTPQTERILTLRYTHP